MFIVSMNPKIFKPRVLSSSRPRQGVCTDWRGPKFSGTKHAKWGAQRLAIGLTKALTCSRLRLKPWGLESLEVSALPRGLPSWVGPTLRGERPRRCHVFQHLLPFANGSSHQRKKALLRERSQAWAVRPSMFKSSWRNLVLAPGPRSQGSGSPQSTQQVRRGGSTFHFPLESQEFSSSGLPQELRFLDSTGPLTGSGQHPNTSAHQQLLMSNQSVNL